MRVEAARVLERRVEAEVAVPHKALAPPVQAGGHHLWKIQGGQSSELGNAERGITRVWHARFGEEGRGHKVEGPRFLGLAQGSTAARLEHIQQKLPIAYWVINE